METVTTQGLDAQTMVPLWLFVLMGIVTTLGGSAGFWAYLTRKDVTRNATTKLLLGLAHDRIIFLGMKYIENGSISTDEYEDYMKYLWEPYSEFGGNGLAEKVVSEVKNLPIRGMVNPIIRAIEEKHEREPVRRAGHADAG